VKKNQSGVVYTTGIGRICPACGFAKEKCQCSRKTAVAPQTDGIVRIRRETKGRNGKGVTVITGVPLAGAELDILGKVLKQRCGTGGTVKDGTIEIQGDQRALIKTELEKRGWTVKLAGG
jgi:translation initiation factor 1